MHDSETGSNRHALVVGASGVIGNAIALQLIEDGWSVTGAGRTPVDGLPGFVEADLLNETAGSFATGSPVTHLFYAGYQARPSRHLEIEPNVTMLANAISLAESSGALERVVMVTGGKHYGLQWGSINVPARETHPRHIGPNFYFDQQDLLEERANNGHWQWSNLIPPYVTGFSERSPMNLAMALALLGTLAKESGRALNFPGPAASWEAFHHLADARQIALAAAWSSRAENAANQIFNVVNGDPDRWCNLWDGIAASFDVRAAGPLPVSLVQLADSAQEEWKRICLKYDLQRTELKKLVDWNWADYMFKTAFANDVILATGKIRQAGFHSYLDNLTVLQARFAQLRSRKIIP